MDIGTTGREDHALPRIFKGRRERTGRHDKCDALPGATLALKMVGAEASYPDSPVGARGRPRRVGGRGGSGPVSCASAGEATSGADLGGSSNYSNEIFED